MSVALVGKKTTKVAAPISWSQRIGERPRNALTAAALFIAIPLLTEHAMPRLLAQHQYLNLDKGVAMAIAAMSLNVLLGYAGQISLGHGALLAAGAFTSGIVTSRWNVSMVFGVLLAIAVTGALSFLLGLPALRLKGLYLAIVTVVFALVMQYSVLRSDVLSGGSAGVALPRRIWGTQVFNDDAIYLVVCLLLLLLAWIVDVNVTSTRLGRAFRVIRENEDTAQAFGIPVTQYKLLAFVVSGGMAGLAGAMYGHAQGFVNNESPFNLMFNLTLVALVVIGGQGRRLAVIITALIFTVFPLFISGLHYWALIIGAALLMFTVANHPEGIGDLLQTRRPPKVDPDVDDDGAIPPLPELPVPARAASAGVRPGEALLEVEEVVVRFGGLRAVDDVSLTVTAGKIVGLIGPNGAGKSTLFNAISGLVDIDQGRIRYRGQEIQGLRCDRRARLGIARSFQHVGLAKDLSVTENFLLAQHQLTGYRDAEGLFMLPRAARDERRLLELAEGAVASLGFDDLADLPVRNLSGGQQRIVEIACLLMTAPDLVMLDEPSAGMAPAAAENLAARLRDLRDAMGRTVLLIEHNVPLVLDVCDHIYVLDAGRLIAEGTPDEVASNPEVISAYFGQGVLS
jgi:ABC-type branched-subunit amino acid transport system ATPase component/ABC-type branched-subunit amino acid transport system permease subunit